MTMENIKAVRVTGTGSAVGFRTRLATLHYQCGASAGRITLTDGNGGTTRIDIDVPGSATFANQIDLPPNGMLFDNGIYVSAITNVTSITIFYEG